MIRLPMQTWSWYLKASGKGTVKFTLSDKGEVLYTSRESLEKENTFVIQVKEPRLWSAEEPVLYDLCLWKFSINREI